MQCLLANSSNHLFKKKVRHYFQCPTVLISSKAPEDLYDVPDSHTGCQRSRTLPETTANPQCGGVGGARSSSCCTARDSLTPPHTLTGCPPPQTTVLVSLIISQSKASVLGAIRASQQPMPCHQPAFMSISPLLVPLLAPCWQLWPGSGSSHMGSPTPCLDFSSCRAHAARCPPLRARRPILPLSPPARCLWAKRAASPRDHNQPEGWWLSEAPWKTGTLPLKS